MSHETGTNFPLTLVATIQWSPGAPVQFGHDAKGKIKMTGTPINRIATRSHSSSARLLGSCVNLLLTLLVYQVGKGMHGARPVGH